MATRTPPMQMARKLVRLLRPSGLTISISKRSSKMPECYWR
jgi:hypothetical protein